MDLAESIEVAELRRQLQVAQRAASRKQRDTDQLVEAVYQGAFAAQLAHGPAPVIKPPKPVSGKGKPEVALLHLTDWQLGKVGVSYGVKKCRQRIEQALQKCVEITDIQRSHHPVNECHIMLGGDMVEGVGIFPGQAFEVEAFAYEQLVECAGLIESVVAFALENFASVTVWEEIGNHGRIGRRGDMPHGDNIDRIAYTLARKRFTDKRLTWNAWAGGLGTHITIGNYKALLVHGDEIKHFGGNIPAYGILKKVTAWSTGVVDPFADCYLGHFHTPMSLTTPNGNRIFVTGSPESDNEYAREFMAAVGKPSQRLHFVEPVRGRVVSEHLLWLD